MGSMIMSDFVFGLIEAKHRRGQLLILSVALNVALGLALLICVSLH